MRLIVITNYTDDCTYSFNETVPVVYDSPEAFLVDFEEAARNALKIEWPNFQEFDIGGQNWDSSSYFKGDTFIAPDILTIDEWFKNIS